MASKTVLVWRCKECDKECLRIREESRCMCGHRFKEHTKASHKCSNGNCKCAGFFYIIAEGAWILRCRCKHKHIEHDCSNLQHKCLKPGCKGCTGFDSPFVCNCDHPWSAHEQVSITITPSLEAMAAFSEVCGGAAGVQRGGIDLSDMPIALMGGAAPPPPSDAAPARVLAKCETAPVEMKPAAAAASSRPAPLRAGAQQPQPLALSRSANGSAADIGKLDSSANAAQAAAPPSRIPAFRR
jgi:hypothetical protein